jgi:SAM-dependent methyltransferase
MIDLKDQKGVHAVRCFPIACLGPLTPEAVSAIYRAAAQEAVEELSASKAFLRPCSFVPSLVKSNATEVIDEVELVRSCDSASLFPVMKAPLKAVNFVYGETSALGMLHVLNTYVPRLLLDVDVAPHTKGLERDLCFVDLGCGNGTCIAAALLSGLFKRIVGVEIMRAKANECRAMSGKLLRSFDRIYSPADTPAPRVEVVEGNFQSYNWWEVADVVYMVTTCFTEDVVEELADRCRQGLRPGALAIFVDKAPLSRDCVPNHAPVMTVSSVSALVMAACDHPTFRLAGNMQARTSWGDACIFVYQKL